MNYGLIFGIIAGVVVLLMVVLFATNYNRATIYESAVIAYLGGDAELYWDDTIFWDYYSEGRNASDCAREMIAVNCEP